jgi:acyl-CoA reductase-like NAD-dependent aldehyde dehydrogenase
VQTADDKVAVRFHNADGDLEFQAAALLARQIDAGIVHVNDQPVGDEPQMPFGGVKDSGFGRFGGSAVVDEFTELRWITVQSGPHPFPF